MNKWLVVILGSLCVFLSDQLIKYWVQQTVAIHQSYSLFSWLSITHLINTGGAFSFFTGHNVWLLVLGLGVIGFVVYCVHNSKGNQFSLHVVLGLVLGAALGNLLDRIRFGGVIDFVDLHWWPVFNLADSVLTCAVLYLLYELWKHPEKFTRDASQYQKSRRDKSS